MVPEQISFVFSHQELSRLIFFTILKVGEVGGGVCSARPVDFPSLI